MPRYWHDRFEAWKFGGDDKGEFYRSIAAEKKPYFMKYIYPALSKEYKNYIKKINKNTMRRFSLTLDELLLLDANELSDEMREFVKYYHYGLPVGIGECVMNKICKRFEEEFDTPSIRYDGNDFCYEVLKSDTEYSKHLYYKVLKIYKEYNSRLKQLVLSGNINKVDKYEMKSIYEELDNEFKKMCLSECLDESKLCNIILDICYKTKNSKRFAWKMCGEIIIKNLLAKHEQIIHIPVATDSGDIEFVGGRFGVIKKKIGEF